MGVPPYVLQVGHVGGEAQKNILLVLLWASTNVGEKQCQVCPKRLVASQELKLADETSIGLRRALTLR